MQVVSDTTFDFGQNSSNQRSVVTIGAYDGVHRGHQAVIGQHVRLYQQVTLGAKRFPTDDKGHLVKGLARHPIVEDDVVIYAGATVLGRITVGAGSSIGGNVWLTNSVPPGSNVTQAQNRGA